MIPPITPKIELIFPDGAIVGVAVGISVGAMPVVGVAVADVPLTLISCVHALLIAPPLSGNVTVY